MMTGKKSKVIPLLGENANRKQMISVINENTLCTNIMVDILDKLAFIVDNLQNREGFTKALQYDIGQYTKGYSDGYTKAIEEFTERFIYTAICEGCSGCTNCHETGSQYRCDHYRYYMQIAEQLKGNKAAEEKEG